MECNVARVLNAGLVAFPLVDLNLLNAKHIKKLRRACKLSSTGLTRTVTARGTCLLHSYPQLSSVIHIFDDRGRDIFSVGTCWRSEPLGLSFAADLARHAEHR